MMPSPPAVPAAIIPPRKNAKPWKPDTREQSPATKPCAHHAASVEPSGDDGAVITAEAASKFEPGQKTIGARKRSGGSFSRRMDATSVKLLGQRLAARDFDRQVAEFQVRVAILNGFTALGIPVTEAVG